MGHDEKLVALFLQKRIGIFMMKISIQNGCQRIVNLFGNYESLNDV